MIHKPISERVFVVCLVQVRLDDVFFVKSRLLHGLFVFYVQKCQFLIIFQLSFPLQKFLIGFVKSWSVIHRGTCAILAEGDSTFMVKPSVCSYSTLVLRKKQPNLQC